MKKVYSLLLISIFFLESGRIFAQPCNAPIINSFSPSTGYIGSKVIITGANFDPIPANNQVFFGATQATVTSASFGTLEVIAPVGATYAPISVRNSCGLIGASTIPFNGIFCGTNISSTTYNTVSYSANVSGGYQMLSQDMDLDGKPDLLVCGFTTNMVSVMRNLSTPNNFSFAPKFDLTFSGATRCIAPADFDGDGKIDLAVVDNGINGVRLFRNTSVPGTFSFLQPLSLAGIGGYQCAAGDLNNDGKIDLVVGSGSDVRTFMNTSTPGNLSFVAKTIIAIGGFVTGLIVGDIDGDGIKDIGTANANNNVAVAVRNTTSAGSSTFSFGSVQTYATGFYPYRLFIGDFDKDGKIDFVTNNFSGANTSVFRNTSVIGTISFAPALNLSSPSSNYRLGVGDADGDGKPDLVTKSSGENLFSVYKNISSGVGNIAFAARVDYPGQAEVSGVVIADLDGDFVPDISTSGTSYNTLRIHRNTSTITDITPPTAICKNIIVPLDPSGNTIITAAMVDNGSSDACGIQSLAIDKSTFTCGNIGPNNVVLTVTDRAGLTASCTAVVTIVPAAITLTGQSTVCQGQTVLLTANQGDSYQWQKNGIDIQNATNQTYTVTETGDYTVTVTNAGGCSGTSSLTAITVNNNPVVTVTPSGTVFLCAGSVNLTTSTSSIYQWKLNGNNINGATQQLYTANAPGSYSVQVVDLFGCTAISTAVDVTSNIPEINVQGNSISIIDGDNTSSTTDNTDFGTTFPSSSVVKTYTLQNTGTGPLDISSINVSGLDAANFTVGGITLPMTIAAGNSTTFTIRFNGQAIKVYNAVVSISNNDCDEALYNYSLKAEISCVPVSFSSCAENINVNTTQGQCNAAVNYTITAQGTPSPTLTYQFSGATTGSGNGTGSGSVFNKGVTNVVVTASNGCGNSLTCSFTVTVEDDEAPVFGTGNNSNGDNVYLRSSVSAPWGLNGNETAMNAVFGVGGWQDKRYETVNTATLFSSTTRFIFMEGGDGTANEMKSFITANKTQIENWVSNGGRLLMNAAPNEGGNIDFGFGGVILVYPNFTQTGVASVPGHPIFNGPLTPVGTSWLASWFGHAILTPAGAGMVKLIHNSQNNLAVLVEAQWGNGIVMFGGMTLPWFQRSDLGIYWPQPTTGNLHKNILSYLASAGINQGNITVAATSGQCGTVVTFTTPVATDNCPGLEIIQLEGLPSGSTFPVGITTNTFIATDGEGNTATYSFTVTVNDGQAPAITQPNNITTGNDAGNCSVQVSFSAQVTDNCSVSSIKYYLHYNTPNQDEISFPKTFALGIHTVTIVAKDAANNTAIRSFTITVSDTEKPTVTKGTISTCYLSVAAAETAALEATTYSDNCSSFEGLDVDVSTGGTCNAVITVTVTDASNNSRSVTYNTKIDNTPPVLSLTPASVTVNCQSIPPVPTVTASDNCNGNVNVTFTPTSSQGSNPALSNYYNYTITRKWFAIDGCGNTVEHVQTITVQDITDPVITCPVNKLSVPFDFGQLYATIAIGTATATDNCADASNITIAGTRSDNVVITNQQYPLGQTTVAWTATDPSDNSDGCTQTMTVRKRNTAITYTGDMVDNKICVQYSDIINLQAKLTDNEGLGTPNNISGRTITFQMLSGTTVLRSKTATTNANGIAVDTFKIEQAPGLYSVKTIFAGDGYFNGSNDQVNCEVKQEDADVEYNGSQYFTTSSATIMAGSVTLAASINDIDDGSDQRGDIRKAKATFRDGGPAGNVLGSANLPVGLVNQNVLINGLSATTQNYTLNTNEAGSGGRIFQVWVGVSDHYNGADAGPTPVTLALPGQDFVTGGGHLVVTNSAGTYAGTVNSKMNFGFTMKWNKSGKSLQGNMNIVFRKWQLYNGVWQWRVYQAKSNSINSMAVVEVGSNGQPVSGTNPAAFRKAIINTKANLKDVTDPLNNIDLGGNHNLTLDAWDHITANGGASDKISVTLMGAITNELLFSSSWSSNATQAQTITGGNINVRNGSSSSSTSINSITKSGEMEITVKDGLFVVKAYPNPTEHEFTLIISSNLNEAIIIQVYDVAGRKIQTLNATANEVIRFGEKLKTGVYIAQVIQGNKKESIRLVKQ